MIIISFFYQISPTYSHTVHVGQYDIVFASLQWCIASTYTCLSSLWNNSDPSSLFLSCSIFAAVRLMRIDGPRALNFLRSPLRSFYAYDIALLLCTSLAACIECRFQMPADFANISTQGCEVADDWSILINMDQHDLNTHSSI